MRWRVLALDAADLNPIDPGGMNPRDNASNSVDQEVAVETWVDHALDQLSRGASQQEVVAKLAHDGCPDPEGVYARAMEHQAQQSNEFDPDVTDPTVAPEVDEQVDFNIPPQGVTAAAGEYELVDKTDNDAHDSGSKEEMEEFARQRNAEEGGSKWVAKPKGWSERNFKEAQMPGPNMSPGVVPTGASPDGLDQYRHTYPEQPEQNMGVQGVDDLKQKLMEAEAKGDAVTAQQLRDQLKTMWQGYTGSVRVANFEGTFRGMESDQWGRLVVALDTPNGPMQLDGEKAEPVGAKRNDEVTEIQTFIDSIPEVKPNDIGSVTARIEGLQKARSMVLTALGRADTEDMGHLIKMRSATASAIKQLVAHGTPGSGLVTEGEAEYLAGSQKYERGAVVAANGSVGGFEEVDVTSVVEAMVTEAAMYDPVKANREDAAILVNELPILMVHDAAAVADLADAVATEKLAAVDPEARQQIVAGFVEAVEGFRAKRAGLNTPSKKTASVDDDGFNVDTVIPDNDGPSEALFM